MKRTKYIFSAAVLLFAVACSTTRNIPEGQYLLNEIKVRTDNKVSTPSPLQSFSRQQPNSNFFFFGKVRLRIYNMAGDTSRWINRAIMRMGEPPVIFSPSQASASALQIEREMNNRGYLNAQVDTVLSSRGRKMKVTYDVKTGTPYRIRNITNAIADTTIAGIVDKTFNRSQLEPGGLFDMSDLEAERERVNTLLRNRGFYTFSKEYVFFEADTTLNSYQVDLFMNIYPPRDSIPYSQYRINNVTVVSGYDFNTPERVFFRQADTTQHRGITIIRGRDNFLRSSTIARNNYIRPGALYADYSFNNTYQAFNNIGAIKQTNIVFTPLVTDTAHLLDARITLAPADAHWFRAGFDGTHSAGDIGIAPSVEYKHQNIFNGGEQFSIKLKGAYEFIRNNDDILGENFYEYGIDLGLTFPQVLFPFLRRRWREQPTANTTLSIGLTNQHRTEYTRQFFNTTINYGWTTNYGRIRYGLDLIDINYVRMPRVSEEFEERFLTGPNSNPLLRESYKDQFVVRTAFSTAISSNRLFRSSPHTYTIRTSAEVAGLIPRLASTLNGSKTNEEGFEEIMGVQYAEYVKGNIDYARTFRFSDTHSLAYRLGFGIAYPFGNSNVLPFERRFFAGGSTSVRGWSTRALGPGAFRSPDNTSNFVNQTGDIRIEMNIESRHRASNLIEIAAFIDAGNIWTIHNYEGQEGGMFKFNSFYKEIAVAYGLGLRFDLNFLLIRFDTGVRLYDPARNPSDRFVWPAWKRAAFHFGIGYPF